MNNYFSHDSNARSDEKLVALRIKHGWLGYGLYWALIEKLRDATCYKLKIDYNLLAYDLRTDASVIKSIMNDFGLFAFDNNECFYSESLLRRMDVKDAKSEKARESANKRWSKQYERNERKTNAMQTQYGRNANISKVKESKVNISPISPKGECDFEVEFEKFRSLYPGTKRGFKTEIDNLKKKHKDWQNIIPLLSIAIKNEIDWHNLKEGHGEFVPQYKNLQTWINGRFWEQEFGKEVNNATATDKHVY